MRIKLDDLLLIGSDPLNTTAQKLTGAVNELKNELDDKSFTITRSETAASGASLIFPAPTISGGNISYNYDPGIKTTSVVIPVGESIKHSDFAVQTNVQGGYATITLAKAISNKTIGILVIN